MTDKNLPNNKIIKALEGAILNAKRCDSKVWSIEIYKLENALDLINRQQADIERLKKDILIAKDAYTMLQTKNEIVKSEAIKKFAKRLKEKSFETLRNYGLTKDVVEVCDIDNLLKEIKEKNK